MVGDGEKKRHWKEDHRKRSGGRTSGTRVGKAKAAARRAR